MKFILNLAALLGLALAPQSAFAASAIDGWALASLTQQSKNGAAYMIITNTSDKADALTSATSDIAKITEVHEMSFDDKGVMRMEEVEKLAIPPHSTVKLEPGGYHIMLMGLENPLEVGDIFDIILTFENNGQQILPVEVHPRRSRQ